MALENKRYALPLTLEQSELIVQGLETYYTKILRKTERLAKHYGDEFGRSIKDSQKLARIQECLQYVTLIHNIEIGKLNPDLAEAAGIPMYEEEEANDNIGEQKPDGGEGETTPLS